MAALACALLAWLIGHTVLGLCRPTRRRGLVELEATAVLVGLALLCVLFTNVVLAVGALTPAVGTGLALLLALPGLFLLRGNRAAARPLETTARPWSPGQRLLLVAISGFGALAIFAAASSPVQGFDALFHYAYKGQLIFHEGIGGEAWTSGTGAVGRIMTHPNYPPGVPLLEVVVGYLRGAFDEDAARPLWSLFALAPAGLLYSALRARGRTPALLGALVWISLPLLYYWRLPNGDSLLATYGLVFGYEAGAARFPEAGPWQRAASWNLDATAGLPLAAFLFGGYRCLAHARAATGDRADVMCGGLLLAGALLAKNEGLALVPLVILVLALAPGRPGGGGAGPDRTVGLGRLALVALLAGALVAVWFVARQGLPSVDEGYGARLTPAGLADSLGRVREVTGTFARAFGNVLLWNLLWPLFGCALLWALRRPRRLLGHEALPAALVVLGATGIFFAVMLVTPWDIYELEGTGVPSRLLFQVAPLAVFAAFALLWEPADEPPQSRN